MSPANVFPVTEYHDAISVLFCIYIIITEELEKSITEISPTIPSLFPR